LRREQIDVQRTAFDEASRRTYGRLYWTLTGLLVLATVAAWLWADDRVRFAVGAVAVVHIVVFGIVNHRRMNRIARERDE
jgi:FtsH-binding integral membrane protein